MGRALERVAQLPGVSGVLWTRGEFPPASGEGWVHGENQVLRWVGWADRSRDPGEGPHDRVRGRLLSIWFRRPWGSRVGQVQEGVRRGPGLRGRRRVGETAGPRAEN